MTDQRKHCSNTSSTGGPSQLAEAKALNPDIEKGPKEPAADGGPFDRRNRILDHILLSRRTIRDFRPDSLPEELLSQLVTAGLHAPYTMAAVENFHDGYFRRFFILRQGSTSMATASARLNAKVKEVLAHLEEAGRANPVYEDKARSWLQRLNHWSRDLGYVPGVTNAPYYIVIAERRGIPDLGQHALAHVLENMWLKATALDLAFQIVSFTSKMGDDSEFCGLLGLRPEEWDLMGCAVGYPRKPLDPSVRPAAGEVTVWLP